MKKTTLFLVVVLAFGITATTEAAVVVFGTEADYNAATGPQIFLIDFDENPQGGTLALGSSFSDAVTFGSPEASDTTQVWWNSDKICDAGSTGAPNVVGPVDGVFTDPVYAFALLFSSSGEAEAVSLYDESDVLLATVTAPNPSGFFGVLSDTPIKKFVIDNGEFWNEAEEEFWPDRFFIDDFRANERLIQVNIDIKGGSCPNPFNPKSKGSVPVAILASDDYVLADIDPESIMLIGVEALDKWIYEDSTQPGDYDPAICDDCFDADDPANWVRGECDINEDGDIDDDDYGYCGDGIDELVVKFDTRALAAAIAAAGGAEKGQCLELFLTGETVDGISIEGSDSIVVLKAIAPAGP